MSEEDGSDQQLISFFAYALVVYPVANYLISRRSWPKHWRILAAVSFLALIASCQVMYENSTAGPNHYQLLNVRRGDGVDKLKKVHRKLSIDLHPDKTPDPEKRKLFLKVEEAYEVLRKEELRGIYERLGSDGVKKANKAAMDTSFVLTQMLVHYLSTAIFAFIMTISDTGGDSMTISFVALVVIFLVECLLVLEREQLPMWLFPYTTAHDFVSLLRRLFPAFMHGCRTVMGALYIDEKAYRVASLSSVSQTSRASAQAVSTVVSDTVTALRRMFPAPNSDGEQQKDDDTSSTGSRVGIVAAARTEVMRRLGPAGDAQATALMEANNALLLDPEKLRVHCRGSPGEDLLYQCALFVGARLLLGYLKKGSA